jgi:hypothetical protein
MYPALRGVGDARVAAHLDEFDDLRRAADGRCQRRGVRSADRRSDGHFEIHARRFCGGTSRRQPRTLNP